MNSMKVTGILRAVKNVDDLIIKSTRQEITWSELYWMVMRGDLNDRLLKKGTQTEKRWLVAKILKVLGSSDHRDFLVFTENYYIDLSTKQPISDFQ